MTVTVLIEVYKTSNFFLVFYMNFQNLNCKLKEDIGVFGSFMLIYTLMNWILFQQFFSLSNFLEVIDIWSISIVLLNIYHRRSI